MLSPEAIGLTSAELIPILLLHSLTQQDSIVASPPIGACRHKNSHYIAHLTADAGVTGFLAR